MTSMQGLPFGHPTDIWAVSEYRVRLPKNRKLQIPGGGGYRGLTFVTTDCAKNENDYKQRRKHTKMLTQGLPGYRMIPPSLVVVVRLGHRRSACQGLIVIWSMP